MSVNIEELSAVALCAECLKIDAFGGHEVADFDDNLPTLPKLLGSACDLCKYVREVILSDEVNIFLEAFGDSRLATETSHVKIWREIYPSEGYMIVELRIDLSCGNISKHVLWCSLHAISGHERLANASGPSANTQFAERYDDPDTVQWLRESLDSSLTQYPLRHSEPKFVPKRLVDVQGDGQMLRLIEPKGDPGLPIPYAALSYCWGSECDEQFQFKTTKETLSDHMEGFDFHAMPQTLKDAVTITRALGIPYLWVDSICIVQKDQLDWQEQCSQMGAVYGMATVTLVAASSTTCREGFLGARNKREFRYPYRSTYNPDDEGFFMISFCGHCEHPGDHCYAYDSFHRDSALCRWARRGWTFQESLLSLRKIIFGNEDVHFISQGTVTSRRGGNAKDIWNLFEQLDTPDQCHSSWMSIMARYSRFTTGSFKHLEDLLPALSGLARQFGTLLPQETYLAGHWSGDLEKTLMWTPIHPFRISLDATDKSEIQHQRSRLRGVVPSWSCMSRGAVKFDLQPEEYSNTLSDVRFVDFTLKLTSDDPYGALLDCRICLECSMMDLSKLTWLASDYCDSVVIGSDSDGLGQIIIDSEWIFRDDGDLVARIESKAGQKWALTLDFDEPLPGTRENWQRPSESDQGLLHSVENLISRKPSLLLLGGRECKFGYGLIVNPNEGQEGLYQRMGCFESGPRGSEHHDNMPFLKEMMKRGSITLI